MGKRPAARVGRRARLSSSSSSRLRLGPNSSSSNDDGRISEREGSTLWHSRKYRERVVQGANATATGRQSWLSFGLSTAPQMHERRKIKGSRTCIGSNRVNKDCMTVFSTCEGKQSVKTVAAPRLGGGHPVRRFPPTFAGCEGCRRG